MARAHGKYIAERRKVPMQPLWRPTREDELFGDLRRAVLKPQPRERHRNAWISEETWRLVDRSLFRNVAVRDPRHNSDHYMVMGLLRGGTAKAHDKYIAGRRKVPMQLQHGPPQIPEEFVLPRRPPL